MNFTKKNIFIANVFLYFLNKLIFIKMSITFEKINSGKVAVKDSSGNIINSFDINKDLTIQPVPTENIIRIIEAQTPIFDFDWRDVTGSFSSRQEVLRWLLENFFFNNDIDSLDLRVTNLENLTIKVAYYASILTTSGTITKPTNSTILLGQFGSAEDGAVCKIVSGKPDFEDYGLVVTLDLGGNYTITGGSLPSSPSALLYYVSIPLKYFDNLDTEFRIEYAELKGLENPVSFLDFDTTLSNPTFLEGRVFYDNTKNALSYYNNESDVTINLGQELIVEVKNTSGSLITNGSVCTSSGGDGTYHLIQLADAHEKDKSRLIGVATHDIENNTTGYLTLEGDVGGLNTSAYSAGQVLYLSDITPGALTTTKPTDGSYLIIVGVVKISDLTDGVITIHPNISELTVEVTDTNGFPPDQRTGTTISFTDLTRTFEIAPTGTEFHYYILGDKYEKTSSDSVVITDVTGGHVIYYDGSTLTSIANPTEEQSEDVIINKCIVAYVYWNSSDSKNILFWDERHGIGMSPTTHEYLHTTRGSQYVSGLALDGIVIGNGSLDSHCQFGNLSGKTRDEDIKFNITTTASTVGYTYLYRSGVSGDWTNATRSGYSFPIGATPLPQYNEFTGATYQLTEVTSGDYMLLHVFGSNNNNLKPIVILGDSEYTTVSLAGTGANDEIARILADLPLPEFVPIGSVIIEGKTSFTNSQNARIVQTTLGEDYKDWRTTELATGAAPTNHNNLAGLELANTGTTWGHIDDQAQTIYGVKTFNSFPITPSSAPTTDYQVANKKYVDDNSGTQTYFNNVDGCEFSWVSATTVRLGTTSYTSRVMDDTNTSLMTFTGTIDGVITTSGAGGLDTGSEASNTLYHVWLIGNSDPTINTPKVLISASASSPTYPTGYNIKRRIGAVRNNASSNFIQFTCSGKGIRRYYKYYCDTDETNILNGGNATTWTTLNCGAFIPAGVRGEIMTNIFYLQGSAGSGLYVRETGKTNDGDIDLYRPSYTSIYTDILNHGTFTCNTSQQIDYYVFNGADTASMRINGYSYDLNQML